MLWPGKGMFQAVKYVLRHVTLASFVSLGLIMIFSYKLKDFKRQMITTYLSNNHKAQFAYISWRPRTLDLYEYNEQ